MSNADLIARLEALDWRPVLGWPYEASPQGHLRSTRTGHLLKPTISARGYARVTFQVNKSRKDIRVHRAVYEAWYGPLGDLQVNHLDGNKLNNRLENLEATSALGNTKHAAETGLRKYGDEHWTRRRPEMRPRGSDLPYAKLSDDAVREIRRRRANGELLTTIAADYGVDQSLISRIAKRRIWTHVE